MSDDFDDEYEGRFSDFSDYEEDDEDFGSHILNPVTVAPQAPQAIQAPALGLSSPVGDVGPETSERASAPAPEADEFSPFGDDDEIPSEAEPKPDEKPKKEEEEVFSPFGEDEPEEEVKDEAPEEKKFLAWIPEDGFKQPEGGAKGLWGEHDLFEEPATEAMSFDETSALKYLNTIAIFNEFLMGPLIDYTGIFRNRRVQRKAVASMGPIVNNSLSESKKKLKGSDSIIQNGTAAIDFLLTVIESERNKLSDIQKENYDAKSTRIDRDKSVDKKKPALNLDSKFVNYKEAFLRNRTRDWQSNGYSAEDALKESTEEWRRIDELASQHEDPEGSKKKLVTDLLVGNMSLEEALSYSLDTETQKHLKEILGLSKQITIDDEDFEDNVNDLINPELLVKEIDALKTNPNGVVEKISELGNILTTIAYLTGNFSKSELKRKSQYEMVDQIIMLTHSLNSPLVIKAEQGDVVARQKLELQIAQELVLKAEALRSQIIIDTKDTLSERDKRFFERDFIPTIKAAINYVNTAGEELDSNQKFDMDSLVEGGGFSSGDLTGSSAKQKITRNIMKERLLGTYPAPKESRTTPEMRADWRRRGGPKLKEDERRVSRQSSKSLIKREKDRVMQPHANSALYSTDTTKGSWYGAAKSGSLDLAREEFEKLSLTEKKIVTSVYRKADESWLNLNKDSIMNVINESRHTGAMNVRSHLIRERVDQSIIKLFDQYALGIIERTNAGVKHAEEEQEKNPAVKRSMPSKEKIFKVIHSLISSRDYKGYNKIISMIAQWMHLDTDGEITSYILDNLISLQEKDSETSAGEERPYSISPRQMDELIDAVQEYKDTQEDAIEQLQHERAVKKRREELDKLDKSSAIDYRSNQFKSLAYQFNI